MSYRWNLSKLDHIPKTGRTVFSCFSCGGGSSMGYKLAGYDVIGNVEIDKQMMEIYQKNHRPRLPFLMDIREFNAIPDKDLPRELFALDVLDGSPPCSTFSMAGKREEKWGRAKQFREGQKKQRLDTLFMDFIETARRLRPKVVIAENVTGLLRGNAKGYVTEVLAGFDRAGYIVQMFSLNAATMGVPQSRERVFFIARRKDIDMPVLHLAFNETPIPYGEIKSAVPGSEIKPGSVWMDLWNHRKPGDRNLSNADMRRRGKNSFFNTYFLYESKLSPVIVSSRMSLPMRFDSPHYMSEEEIILAQSFPQDYDFCGEDVQYVCGMSVPPVMMERISAEIYRQWLAE